MISFKHVAIFALVTTSLLVFQTSTLGQKGPEDVVKTKQQWKELNADKVVLLKKEPGNEKKEDSHAATAAIIVDAPAKAVWDVISDKEGAPDYVKTLKEATIIEETDEYYLVEQTVKIGVLKPVTYTVKSVADEPSSIIFTRHSGDLKEIDGYWKLFPLDGGNKTLLVYRLGLKPGFAVPNFVVKNSLKSSIPDALREIRGEVKRREGLERTVSR